MDTNNETVATKLRESFNKTRDSYMARFTELIDELVEAKDIGGSTFYRANDILQELSGCWHDISMMDYALNEIDFILGDAYGEAKS